MIATLQNCTPPSGHCDFQYVTEASDLRLPPGKWPHSIDTDLGNGQPFELTGFDDHGAGRYRQRFGCISLLVIND